MAMNFDTKDVLLGGTAALATLTAVAGVAMAASAQKGVKRVETRVGAIEATQTAWIASGVLPAPGTYIPGQGYDGRVIG